jgi:hypothetical protein
VGTVVTHGAGWSRNSLHSMLAVEISSWKCSRNRSESVSIRGSEVRLIMMRWWYGDAP